MIGIAGLALLILAAIFVHKSVGGAARVASPALPAIFLLDLQYWLANFGQNLDPKAAPLSSSIKPFVPPVLGEGKIAQFSTVAEPEFGLWLAIAASLVILVGLYFHRRAYKPLVRGTVVSDTRFEIRDGDYETKSLICRSQGLPFRDYATNMLGFRMSRYPVLFLVATRC